MRLNRLIAILLLLESRGQLKARELAEALETSERTIYRDIDALSAAGVPIYADPGPTGGFALIEGYSERLTHLQCDDVINLYLSGIGVRPNQTSEASLALKKTLLRLEHSLPDAYRGDIDKAKNRFFFDPDVWWNERPALPHMDLLRRAVWDSRKVRIGYLKSGDAPSDITERVVHPYGLVVKNTDWYLVAWCEQAEAMRTFSVPRVITAQLTPMEFTIPSDFNLERHWKQSVEGFRQRFYAPDASKE